MSGKGKKPDWPKNWWTVKFVNEPFLTEAEWRTFLNRPPVRYTGKNLRKHRKPDRCAFCGEAGSKQNPLQAAHLIPFFKGVQHLGLTPEFLDDPRRLKWAHRKDCNARVELSFTGTLEYLREQGIPSLPSFLLPEIHRMWESVLSR